MFTLVIVTSPVIPKVTDTEIDQTPSAALGRIRLHLPEQADFLIRGRVRIIKLSLYLRAQCKITVEMEVR